jgi:hypothetical protein
VITAATHHVAGTGAQLEAWAVICAVAIFGALWMIRDRIRPQARKMIREVEREHRKAAKKK